MEESDYLSLLPHKGVARWSTVNLFPHWCNGNYGEVCWVDLSAWVMNRWEHAMTGEEDFDDNNRDKSFGGRLGFTLLTRAALLNFGLGGFYGPERRHVVDSLRLGALRPLGAARWERFCPRASPDYWHCFV
jgi:hypothetical protein